MIPELISKKHIDVALSTILREGVPSRRRGRDYCVVVDGARVVEKATRVRIHLTSACPDAALFRLLAGRLAAAGP